MKLIKKEFDLDVEEVIERVKKIAVDFNFIIRDIFDMTENFKKHGVNVDEDFVYYSIMLCNPKKAYGGISNSLIRGAVLLPPKQLVVYPENGKTVVSYVSWEEKDVAEILPEDKGFQEGLSESCDKIEELIMAI